MGEYLEATVNPGAPININITTWAISFPIIGGGKVSLNLREPSLTYITPPQPAQEADPYSEIRATIKPQFLALDVAIQTRLVNTLPESTPEIQMKAVTVMEGEIHTFHFTGPALVVGTAIALYYIAPQGVVILLGGAGSRVVPALP